MSLDVYLTLPSAPRHGTGIFVRDAGQTREITRAEWDEKFPGREPVVVERDDDQVFSANITHNLNTMADAAGIYTCLWRPDEHGITRAEQLIEPLRAGLARLKAEPEKYEALNPKNGWGSYSAFVPWVERYLEACEKYPHAEVSVWR